MAEERTLGLARATERSGEEQSKEEIQRRMEVARDSISHTVTEIKETVAHQVQNVKDTLDWREQFRKRPAVWSAGAVGAGFLTGYCLAGRFKHKEDRYGDYSGPNNLGYSTSRAFGLKAHSEEADSKTIGIDEASFFPGESEQRPGLLERFKESSAYDNLSKEVSSLGSKLVEELSSTAHLVVLPFLLSKFKEMVGLDQLENSAAVKQESNVKATDWSEPNRSLQGEPSVGH